MRRAYDLAQHLYCNFIEADGVPLVAHVTGVASICARLNLSSELVAMACLHNVYTNGDFGDGRKKCATAFRRQLVRDAVGETVESHVHRFPALLRNGNDTLLSLGKRSDSLTPRDRQLLVIDLADVLEKCHDFGPLYYGGGEPLIDRYRREGPDLAGLARDLGYPELAAALSEAITALLSESVPPSLRSRNTRQDYARQEIALSHMRRPEIATRRMMQRAWRKLRRAASPAAPL
ncbi:hypothetical protein BH24PSE2_BH24PSE2_08830 [soil metagenome]